MEDGRWRDRVGKFGRVVRIGSNFVVFRSEDEDGAVEDGCSSSRSSCGSKGFSDEKIVSTASTVLKTQSRTFSILLCTDRASDVEVEGTEADGRGVASSEERA